MTTLINKNQLLILLCILAALLFVLGVIACPGNLFLVFMITIVVCFCVWNIYSFANCINIKLSTILFLCGIFFYPFMLIIGMDIHNEFSKKENKALTKFPGYYFWHESFPSRMDSYIEDRVGFKYLMLSMKWNIPFVNATLFDLVGKVVIGKNDWLFYSDDAHKDYLRINAFSQQERDKLVMEIKAVKDYADSQGINLIMFLGPHKHNIYPEYYSPIYQSTNQVSRYDIFLGILRELNIDYIDTKQILINAKNDNILYYKHDSHWNTFGGGDLIYRALLKKMQNSKSVLFEIPSNQVEYLKADKAENNLLHMSNGFPIKESDIKYIPVFNNDITITTIYEDTLFEGYVNYNKTSTAKSTAKVLLVHDSFSRELIPFLERSVQHLINRWEWGASPLKYKELIEELKPDIIIWEMQEGYLDNLIAGKRIKN